MCALQKRPRVAHNFVSSLRPAAAMDPGPIVPGTFRSLRAIVSLYPPERSLLVLTKAWPLQTAILEGIGSV